MGRICESDIPCPAAYEAAPMRKLYMPFIAGWIKTAQPYRFRQLQSESLSRNWYATAAHLETVDGR